MKKILFVSHTANFSKFNRNFMKWFREQGWEVSYASDGKEEILDCDHAYTFPFARSPFSSDNIKAYKMLKQLIQKEKFDIIHCHTPVGGVVTRLAAKKARKNGTVVMYTGHGLHFYKGAPKLNWMLYYPVEKFCAKYTDALLTINEEDYDNVRKYHFPAKQIFHVHGVGVSLERFHKHTRQEKEVLRSEYGYAKDAFLMIVVAEINKNKNQQFLMQSVAHLKEKYPDIKLLLVGQGELEEQLKSQVKEQHLEDWVEFLGYRKDVDKLLALSDVLVTASYREGLPVNIMEAMASGLPVICTDVRGQRELIHNNRNGYIYEIDNEDEFKNAVIKLMTEEDMREKFASANVQDVERYSLPSVMKEMEQIYRSYM